MDLLMRQTVETNALEIYALYCSIQDYFFLPIGSDSKITVAEALAIEPLRKLASRLHTRFLSTFHKPTKYRFGFSFSPQELLAIHVCIRNTKAEPLLQVILGKVDQKALNLDNQVKLNNSGN